MYDSHIRDKKEEAKQPPLVILGTMISKSHRFHGHGSLNFVYRKGKSVRSEYVGLRYARSRSEDYRLAVVVSKKVSKSAVTRNRIRRVIYEIVRLYRKDSTKQWPYDLVMSVYDERILDTPHSELTQTIRGLLDKAGV